MLYFLALLPQATSQAGMLAAGALTLGGQGSRIPSLR